MTSLDHRVAKDGRDSGIDAALADKDFATIAALLHTDSGISLSEEKRPLVFSRLLKRLRALGLEHFRDYCELLTSADGAGERQMMLSALTTNVTAFFREDHHFEQLRTKEFPALAKAARAGASVRIWSAGCSKGHEPFSIAMTLLSVMPDAERHDIKILATDIDTAVVATAREARYSDEEFAAVRPDARQYFDRDGSDGMRVVKDSVRRLVTFRELNLMASWPMKLRYQVIFCRNVAIYFDATTQARLWGRFAQVTAPGALLCIGHSERLAGEAQNAFDLIGTTAYRRREAA